MHFKIISHRINPTNYTIIKGLETFQFLLFLMPIILSLKNKSRTIILIINLLW
jgi:hypothetical protein